MNLNGCTIRIIVTKPLEFKTNLFGTIVSNRGGMIQVKLTAPITINGKSSEVLEFRSYNSEDRFKRMSQHYSMNVKGALVVNEDDEFDFLIEAIINLD